ncbi:prolyl oligopeptidase family serine peptidase [Mesorhizobium sp. CGMCC 1.15528]|uniref:Prolyl oligopeptidase family serine peptidase n=1 Tax=Mesorhizobium zhangyense TaxID=1776730 RepID=A0A7C9RC65_9HYPH|nr:prolyl oligopeptidase family serine peptidase [Mesorhizobium zhangyense]
MQRLIAANWLVEEGVADKSNMTVMGGSYAGYSAALAMTGDPRTSLDARAASITPNSPQTI